MKVGAIWMYVGFLLVAACQEDRESVGSEGGATSGAGGSAGAGEGGVGGRPPCLPNVAPECVLDLCRKDKNDCGDPASILDEHGCYRAKCSSNQDCASGEECRETSYAPVSCGFAPPNEDACMCGWKLIILTESMCFPVPPDSLE